MTSILVPGLSEKFLKEFDAVWRKNPKYKSRVHAIRIAMKFFIQENKVEAK